MPLRYLRHAQLNLAAYAACVAAAEQVVPYAQGVWLQAVNGPWDAVVEPDEATGGYRSVLPVPVQRRLWGREALQPPFTQQLGLLTTAASQHRDAGEYLAMLSGQFARLHVQLNTDNHAPAVPAGFRLAERVTYHLPLSADHTALHAGYCADYRRRLRLNAQAAAPLRVTEETDAAELIQLFQTQKGDEVGGMKPAYYRRLQQLYHALRADHQTVLLTVRAATDHELLAGALFIRYRSRLVYLFAAATPAGKKAAAPLLLLDEAIRRYAATPGLVLDFEGGTIPGIARFFANFGARPVPYYTLTQTARPWYLNWKR
ncbi:GNAT family N-acetyltransferase [Hymenobacter busanensis]|uniref:GNAT family N-acetyltransferase n=1 Tax=Hymenobacter busanensis TaxID=2607656 RepID=A0A7L4ZXJ1_9BACT|nr:GNAT family N-acetyltransferase [Hymenobacter busanensis]KAA9325571.1 GNAT family N-acetyltransferase [Hymenobacter busanensis]QHJ07757.1 GNAT family N-acetyltransferase [Hymenobacter busanensis]